MTRPMHRSRTFRRVFKKTTSGSVIHYIKRKPRKAVCGKCGSALHGIPRELPYRMRLMPKTKKRPERPYGGVLCSSCSRVAIIENHISEAKND